MLRAKARRHVQSQLWFGVYFAVLPLLAAGALVALLAAMVSGERGGALVGLMVLLALLLVMGAPIALYRRQYRNRLIVERQLERSELCPDCGRSLESLIKPVCPGCGLDFRVDGAPRRGGAA